MQSLRLPNKGNVFMMWDFQAKYMKDFMKNHAKDFGRMYCELLLDSPKHYKEFMEGFYDEYNKRHSDDLKP